MVVAKQSKLPGVPHKPGRQKTTWFSWVVVLMVLFCRGWGGQIEREFLCLEPLLGNKRLRRRLSHVQIEGAELMPVVFSLQWWSDHTQHTNASAFLVMVGGGRWGHVVWLSFAPACWLIR